MSTNESSIVSRIKARIAQSDQQNLEQEQAETDLPIVAKVRQRLAGQQEKLNSGLSIGSYKTKLPDTGLVGSAAFGVKKGVAESFFMHPETPAGIDSGPEKTAAFLGTMVGLGIGFVPYAIGTGAVLGGVGLAARLKGVNTLVQEGREIYPLYNFVRNTIAGGLQAGGMSETAGDIPKNVAIGAAAGGLVEGFFLRSAMRARAPHIDLSDIGFVADDIGTQIQKELAVAPAQGSTPEAIELAVNAMRPDDFSLDEVLSDFAGPITETVRIPNATDARSLAERIKLKFPEAGVYIRNGNELLVHNPVDPASQLSPSQLAQWGESGTFDGMQAIYNGREGDYVTTGVTKGISADRIQLRRVDKPGVMFAALKSDVTLPLTPRISTFASVAQRRGVLQNAIQAAKTRLGFVIPTANPDYVRRGVVDVSKFESASTMGEFASRHVAQMKLTPGITGATPDEILESYAKIRGIPGVVLRDTAGEITNVRVFEQGSVSYLKEGPNFGVTANQSVLSTNMATGQFELRSFQPTWRNAITPVLREQGIPEKEIKAYLDMYARNRQRSLIDMMDPEMKNIMEASDKQFFENCM